MRLDTTKENFSELKYSTTQQEKNKAGKIRKDI